MDICFFCRIENPALLERNEFYAVDMRILRELGHRVTVATTPWRIPRADLYVTWWWTWALFPLLRAKLGRKPVVILGTFDHVLPSGELETFPHRPWWHRIMIKSVLKHADANIVVSRDQQDYLQRHFHVNGLGYSPHVIDTELYRPGNTSRQQLFATFCWMNSGNSRRKCIPEAIRAVARLHSDFPDYRLMICGEKGGDFPSLQELVRELNAEDYIGFPGVVTREQKIEIMQRCAVYLQPTRAEGFGVAILEAMSCGATVVTSPVGAVPEVGGDAVRMVDGADPAAIAEAVGRLLLDDADRHTLGRLARERAVREFSYARRKKDIEQVIGHVVVTKAKAA